MHGRVAAAAGHQGGAIAVASVLSEADAWITVDDAVRTGTLHADPAALALMRLTAPHCADVLRSALPSNELVFRITRLSARSLDLAPERRIETLYRSMHLDFVRHSGGEQADPWWMPQVDIFPAMIRGRATALQQRLGAAPSPNPSFPINVPSISLDLNYDAGTGRAAQPLAVASGASCSNCYVSGSFGMSGGFALCLFTDTPADFDYSNGVCGAQNIALFINATFAFGGDFEFNLGVTMSGIPNGNSALTPFWWSQFNSAAIPMATGITVTPGFLLQGMTATTGSGLQTPASITYSAHLGTKTMNLGANLIVRLPSILNPSPSYTLSPIFTFSPQINAQGISFSQMVAGPATMALFLAPQLQSNFTLLSSTVLPVLVTPRTGLTVSVAAAGGSTCNSQAR
jgi:hypothetical protein